MEAITLPIYNTAGKEVDKVKLNASVFDGIINSEAIYQAITAYRANQRKGLAATKTRGEVSGGGKKPWKQKGTGRARVGSTRSPLWRHGGVIFGPHPRDFSYTLPDKIKAVALKSSLNAKVKENNFIILDELKLDTTKTKEALKLFTNLKVSAAKNKKGSSVLLLLNEAGANAKLALRNIDFLRFNLASDTNVYEVLAHKKLIITKDGLTKLTKRLAK
ncbi:MAG: 50S ribosomal protein L4 [Candidatus Omnitrophota bacterium]|nr:50S ribosomal protein L4 [Candidatus Omnitrophota bacterium]